MIINSKTRLYSMDNHKGPRLKHKPILDVDPRLIGLVFFILGVIFVLGIRFTTYQLDSTHYHANFGLFINTKQDEFKNFTFYEEVQTCSLHDENNMRSKAHMHDQSAGLIHVHDKGVTWGQFFANLGYTLGDKVIVTDQGVFADGVNGSRLNFKLNGNEVKNIANTVIKSEDVLLVNYGTDNETDITKHSVQIPRNAHEANSKADPASCSGSADAPTFGQRLRAAFGLTVHSD